MFESNTDQTTPSTDLFFENQGFVLKMPIKFAIVEHIWFKKEKQYQKRMESLNKLQKGYEVITIGGLYGTVDEVDTERKTVVLDVDGVYLTFELTAIKTVLPVSEGVTAGAVEGAGESDSIIDGE